MAPHFGHVSKTKPQAGVDYAQFSHQGDDYYVSSSEPKDNELKQYRNALEEIKDSHRMVTLDPEGEIVPRATREDIFQMYAAKSVD